MPWTGESFAKHNHGLSPAQSAHASHIANHVLQSTGDEGEAIATANKYYQHHRDAGGFLPSMGGIGGGDPQNQNPMIASMIQRYAGLPVDKLMELAQTMGNSPQGAIIQKILMQKQTQPQNQPGAMHATTPTPAPAPMPQPAPQAPVVPPVAQASGGATPHRDMGGMMMSASQGSPWWERQEARSETNQPSLGFLHGPTPGRADALNTTAPAGSHVIPADVVAGLGQGNSIAGAARMQRVIGTGPMGMPLPRETRGRGPPRAPPPFKDAKGGDVPATEAEDTPVKLSHGEYVVQPEHVLAKGKGDREAGHKWWDDWIVKERKKQIKRLQKLPGPVKT
jgi:hypothetical protein